MCIRDSLDLEPGAAEPPRLLSGVLRKWIRQLTFLRPECHYQKGCRKGSSSNGCEWYLDYALSHPREYELFCRKEYELSYSPRATRAGVKPVGRPAREAMRRKLAEKLGGSADERERMLMALWMMVHGTAMLLIEKSILPSDATQARAIFTKTIATMVREAARA